MPSGTPLCRNSTYDLRVARIHCELLLASIFPRERLLFCFGLFPHSRTSFSSCTSPSQNPVEHACSKSLLSFCVLSFTFLYPFFPSLLHFLFSHFTSENPVEHTSISLYCGFYLFCFFLPIFVLGFS